MSELFHRFFADDLVRVVLLVLALDLALGLIAAAKAGSFRLSYVADFARNDVLGKVLPLLVLYGGKVYAENQDIVIPGFDFDIVVAGAAAITIGALAGSLLGSIRDLGLIRASDQVAGPDPASPTVPPAE
jgi:hypothetical protein